MAERDPPHTCHAGFVTLFARTPQLCAGALAGLGSALWLNVVGPFAGLVAAWGALALVNALAVAVVAVLVVLVTTAGILLAADWRADVASHQAWADIDVAAAELRLPSQIDPLYLSSTTGEALQSVFRAHRFTSLAPTPEASTHTPAADRTARIVAASGGSIQTVAASEATPRIAGRTSAADTSDVAMARPYPKAANASFGQQSTVVTSCRARLWVFRAQPAVTATRLVANGGAWSDWSALDRCTLTRPLPHVHLADIIVLSGDRGDRNQRHLPGPSTSDGAVKSDEPPSCRGPPLAVSNSRVQKKTPEPSIGSADQVRAAAALPSADPIVRDNLGHPVPICAAELDAIETYLGQALRHLLAPDQDEV